MKLFTACLSVLLVGVMSIEQTPPTNVDGQIAGCGCKKKRNRAEEFILLSCEGHEVYELPPEEAV